jgi:polyhydroxyalkanoate synthesis regulator phasin
MNEIRKDVLIDFISRLDRNYVVEAESKSRLREALSSLLFHANYKGKHNENAIRRFVNNLTNKPHHQPPEKREKEKEKMEAHEGAENLPRTHAVAVHEADDAEMLKRMIEDGRRLDALTGNKAEAPRNPNTITTEIYGDVIDKENNKQMDIEINKQYPHPFVYHDHTDVLLLRPPRDAEKFQQCVARLRFRHNGERPIQERKVLPQANSIYRHEEEENVMYYFNNRIRTTADITSFIDWVRAKENGRPNSTHRFKIHTDFGIIK